MSREISSRIFLEADSYVTIGLGTLDVGFKVAESEVTAFIPIVDIVKFKECHFLVNLADDTLPRCVTLQFEDVTKKFPVLFYNGLLFCVMTAILQCLEPIFENFNSYIFRK